MCKWDEGREVGGKEAHATIASRSSEAALKHLSQEAQEKEECHFPKSENRLYRRKGGAWSMG